ncbi:MAG TPA: cupredoxin domain-containing protein [Solimonas sp.]|nr:cupredoxin domain-containing protein [Solimonas sp.]
MDFQMIRALAVLALLLSTACSAAEVPEFELVIKDHRFTPAELTVPAGQKLQLVVKNQDATPEEFESHELSREKVIAGNSQAVIKLGPLKPGEYSFVGEFNEATAKGRLIVK